MSAVMVTNCPPHFPYFCPPLEHHFVRYYDWSQVFYILSLPVKTNGWCQARLTIQMPIPGLKFVEFNLLFSLH